MFDKFPSGIAIESLIINLNGQCGFTKINNKKFCGHPEQVFLLWLKSVLVYSSDHSGEYPSVSLL